LAIIALTGIVRLILIPLTTPQLESAKKMQDLAPELEKLKSKFKDDKQKLAQAQMELYKKHGINPAAGCLPQIIQMIILITLYQAFNLVIKPDGIKAINDILYSFNRLSASSFNFNFLYLNLDKPDLIALNNTLKIPGLFVILATVFQFLSSKLMMPALKKEEQITAKTETKQDDMSVAMQKNMMYMFPAMTLIFGYTMPSGVMLYWFIFSLFSFIQQMIVNNKQKRLVVKND
jgi:YidC/Oxa1 family membrane protein insertase